MVHRFSVAEAGFCMKKIILDPYDKPKLEVIAFSSEDVIATAQISGDDMDEGVVGLGSNVRLKKNGVEITYSIVGSNEANPFENKISDLSVIGKAIVGKVAGDKVIAQANAGAVEIEILEVWRNK